MDIHLGQSSKHWLQTSLAYLTTKSGIGLTKLVRFLMNILWWVNASIAIALILLSSIFIFLTLMFIETGNWLSGSKRRENSQVKLGQSINTLKARTLNWILDSFSTLIALSRKLRRKET